MQFAANGGEQHGKDILAFDFRGIRERHPRRSTQCLRLKNDYNPEPYKLFTRFVQSSALENIGPERPLPGHLAAGAVLSPTRITLENNGKIRP